MIRSAKDCLDVMHAIQPSEHDGVPYCDELGCPAFDGRRCVVLGHRPSIVCIPAVRGISAAAEAAAEAAADDWERRAKSHGCQDGGDSDCG